MKTEAETNSGWRTVLQSMSCVETSEDVGIFSTERKCQVEGESQNRLVSCFSEDKLKTKAGKSQETEFSLMSGRTFHESPLNCLYVVRSLSQVISHQAGGLIFPGWLLSSLLKMSSQTPDDTLARWPFSNWPEQWNRVAIQIWDRRSHLQLCFYQTIGSPELGSLGKGEMEKQDLESQTGKCTWQHCSQGHCADYEGVPLLKAQEKEKESNSCFLLKHLTSSFPNLAGKFGLSPFLSPSFFHRMLLFAIISRNLNQCLE